MYDGIATLILNEINLSSDLEYNIGVRYNGDDKYDSCNNNDLIMLDKESTVDRAVEKLYTHSKTEYKYDREKYILTITCTIYGDIDDTIRLLDATGIVLFYITVSLKSP